jgi:colicin import membrane protein
MKLPEMKTGLTISALAHAALLLWGLISFAARPLEAMPNEGLPVDIISDKQFSEITKGVKNAKKVTKPAPVVEKIGDPNQVDDTSAKINEKKEIKSAKAETEPPPMPEPKPPEKKPEKKPEPEKKAEKEPEKKKEPPKVDPIAETLKKEEAKKKAEAKEQAKKEEAKKKAEAKAKAEKEKKQPQFDPTKIAALLDKRDPTRQAAAGSVLNTTASLGFANGHAAQLSQSEIDALRRRLGECWHPPVGAADGAKLKVVLRVLFKRDATVAQPPQLVAATASSFGPAMAESAIRAIMACQPFTMLRAEHYEQWKDIEITFDPREMFGG